MTVVTNKKLIEVALPLEAINIASAREKSIRHGHPSTLHLWWARRPLAAARAVIFSQMVDDPSSYLDELRGDSRLLRKAQGLLEKRTPVWEKAHTEHERAIAAGMNAPAPGPEPTLEDILAEIERNRLFKIIEDLVLWENTTNEKVLDKARAEIWQSWRRTCARNADHPRAAELFNRKKLPAFHDPFAGGGALPLEAQRLGLESYASDLNPVAVLINKAMIEIPPKFAGRPPVHPPEEGQAAMPREWKGAQGLAEDVRYYGKWIRDEAEKRIGHLYPKVEITAAMVRERPDLKQYLGQKLTVIAWIWARTVRSPNPAFSSVEVPLATTFILASRPGKETYIEPVKSGDAYSFRIKRGPGVGFEAAKHGTKLARANFSCILSGASVTGEYIKREGHARRMGQKLMAIALEGNRERVYLPPTPEQETIAMSAHPLWRPDISLSGTSQYLGVKPYGVENIAELFTPRQLQALTCLSDLIGEARQKVELDGRAAALSADGRELSPEGLRATAYAEAVTVYLTFALNKQADLGNSLCGWEPIAQCPRHLFGRQAIPMIWDYAEGNPLGDSSGSWNVFVDGIASAFAKGFVGVNNHDVGHVAQADAAQQTISQDKVVSTDPPYYDNVPYADLSDFFYAWMRRTLRSDMPDLFNTIATPKDDELVAFAYRHDGKAGAERFFLNGMSRAMTRMSEQANPAFPLTIYYAFKQAETGNDNKTVSTGWETFLSAILNSELSILGTWPMHTENDSRLRGQTSNALASSVVIVCRRREKTIRPTTRREFVSRLKDELPSALKILQAGNIAPVDLAQASIGPAMAIFSQYEGVLDASGQSLDTREVLALVNQVLDEVLAEQEGDFDSDTRWALGWFEQAGFEEGEYGIAETLSKAKNTSVAGMVDAGILVSSRGKVHLLKPSDLPDDWEPGADTRLTAWEILHHLIRLLETSGEGAAAKLVHKLGTHAEVARELAYRLYTICERKKRAAEALSYNALVQSWPEIMRLAQEEAEGRGHAQMVLPEAKDAQ